MTEIKIEKKSPYWPWIIIGVVVVGVVIYFLAFNNRKEVINELPQNTVISGGKVIDLISVKENNGTVAAYINFINKDDNMSLDHTYTNEALVKLREAIIAMAGEIGYRLQSDMGKVNEYTEEITKKPFETTHADDIRKATDILSEELQKMQQAKYPVLVNDVTELKNASASIDPDVLTLKQKDAVKSFFKKAADLLQKMN